MNWTWVLILGAGLTAAGAQGQQAFPNPTPSAAPATLALGPKGEVPWDDWFAKNSTVTDKTEYVHFFWNAQDFKAYFEVKAKKSRLAEAALQLVSRLYPEGAKADPVKVDIVYVLERDSYNMPRWDTLVKVAHFEFSRAKALKPAKLRRPLPESAFPKTFDKFEFY